MPAKNSSMRKLQATLLAQFKNLNEALDKVTDADQARAIVTEMQEINHRVALVGGLLFAAQAKSLTKKTARVAKATTRVNAAIKDITNIQAFLDAMSEFLGLVDEAIDLAKTL